MSVPPERETKSLYIMDNCLREGRSGVLAWIFGGSSGAVSRFVEGDFGICLGQFKIRRGRFPVSPRENPDFVQGRFKIRRGRFRNSPGTISNSSRENSGFA